MTADRTSPIEGELNHLIDLQLQVFRVQPSLSPEYLFVLQLRSRKIHELFGKLDRIKRARARVKLPMAC
jgi:hypothetical protein